MNTSFSFELREISDELVGCLLFRHIALASTSDGTSIWRGLGRGDPAARIMLPPGLDAVAAILPSKVMSSVQLAIGHTAFPYVSPILSHDQRGRLLSALREPAGDVGRHYIEPVSRQLLFCPRCRLQQLEEHGSASWGRTHQLPGVFLCPIHDNRLHRACFSPFTKQAMDFLAGLPAPSTEVSCPIPNDLARRIAQISHRMLNDAGMQNRMASLCSGIGTLSREAGLTTPGGSVRRDLGRDFGLRFGNESLRALGLPIEAGPEVLYRTVRGRGVRRPLHLILVLLFIEIDPLETSLLSIPIDRGDVGLPKRTPDHRRTPTDARLAELRAWLLQAMGRGLTRSELEQEDSTGYRTLRAHDLEWMEAQLPPKVELRRPWKYFTEAEDLELWTKLKEVCDRHAGSAAEPPKKLTKNTILREAGLIRLENRLSRLPRCSGLINDHAVDLEEHWRRRFDWGVEQAIARGMIMSWTEFTEFVRFKVPRMPQFVEASKKAHRRMMQLFQERAGVPIKPRHCRGRRE